MEKEKKDFITDYIPQPIEIEKSARTVDFIQQQNVDGAERFKINPEVSEQIGLSQHQKENYKRKFDAEVFKYVQKIKDDAYEKSYQEGLSIGKQEALVKSIEKEQERIELVVSKLEAAINDVKSLKAELYEGYKKEITDVCYFLAEKIIFKEIQKDESFIDYVVNEILKNQHGTEKLMIKISHHDYDYLMDNLGKINPEFNLNKNNFKMDENLNIGDIILESSQGQLIGNIDSRLERLKKIIGDTSL